MQIRCQQDFSVRRFIPMVVMQVHVGMAVRVTIAMRVIVAVPVRSTMFPQRGVRVRELKRRNAGKGH